MPGVAPQTRSLTQQPLPCGMGLRVAPATNAPAPQKPPRMISVAANSFRPKLNTLSVHTLQRWLTISRILNSKPCQPCALRRTRAHASNLHAAALASRAIAFPICPPASSKPFPRAHIHNDRARAAAAQHQSDTIRTEIAIRADIPAVGAAIEHLCCCRCRCAVDRTTMRGVLRPFCAGHRRIRASVLLRSSN